MSVSKSYDSSQSSYLTDHWTIDDFLNFGDFRPALQGILRTAQTPLTVGVFGPWGSGKSSLLKMLQHDLDATGLYRTVWFTAWKYDRHEALWRAFLLRVLDALYPRVEPAHLTPEQQQLVELLGRLQESVYRQVEWQELGKLAVSWGELMKEGGKGTAEIAAAFIPGAGLFKQLVEAMGGDKKGGEELGKAAKAIRREIHSYHREQLLSMEQFEEAFRQALQKALSEKGRLIVFVDDLDRCLPEQAIEVLEAIKLFLEVEGAVFVLGMDKEVVETGIQARYGALFHSDGMARAEFPISGDAYLQKIVQIPFHLPPLIAGDLAEFIAKLDEKSPRKEKLDETTRRVFAEGLLPNPRQVKRALNIFRLLRAVAETRETNGSLKRESVAWPLLAKTVIIQTQYPTLYRHWRQYPRLIQRLEQEYSENPVEESDLERGAFAHKAGGEDKSRQMPDSDILAPYLNDRRKYALLARMLSYPPAAEAGRGRLLARFQSLDREQMAVYVRLAGAVEAEAPVESVQGPIWEEILSGDMVKIVDALDRFAVEETDAKGPKHRGLRQQLLQVIGDPQREVKERLGAGNALSILGDDRDFAEMLPVPAGPFTMGSGEDDAAAQDWEKPQHTLHVAAFRIGKYPVTNTQYAQFVAAAGRPSPPHWRGQEPPPELRTHPVVNVTWRDAMAYCQWLSQQTGEEHRLPTEAEWEKAARGDQDARPYPWEGGFDPRKCNMADTGIGGTSPVGIFPAGASPYGCLDMSGNVWEWTMTKWTDDYANYRPDNRPDRDERRVLRGGSFDVDRRGVRCAFRLGDNPDNWFDDFGFRVVAPGL